jgi:hypothetical protein
MKPIQHACRHDRAQVKEDRDVLLLSNRYNVQGQTGSGRRACPFETTFSIKFSVVDNK